MSKGQLTAYIDVAQVVLYMFWLFFAGVIWYLVRENRREGYPMDSDRGVIEGWLPVPTPKTYLLDNGEQRHAPSDRVSPQTLNAERVAPHGGSAYEPLGNPLLAGVGPGAWADRADHPDLDHDGVPKIRPLSTLPECGVSERDPDPRGMTLFDGENDPVGTINDLWLDVPEMSFRYLQAEVQGASGPVQVLVPMTFCRVRRDGVQVHALVGAGQFAGAPVPATPGQISLLEEERICAYFGAGLLYATPERAEPLV
jgi:photosynthetic reaction center H subunit